MNISKILGIAGAALLFTGTIAHADTYSNAIPSQGCYKNNGSDLCVETTLIHCGDVYAVPLTKAQRRAQLAENVRKYGPVIASLCDDGQWMSEQAIADGDEIQRLRQRLAQYKTLLRNKR